MAVGKVKSRPAHVPLGVRLQDMQGKISDVFNNLKLGDKDVLICESQTTMRDPRAAFKVEQVRGIFEVVARSRSMCVPGRLNPRSVHNEIMGLRGRQLSRDLIKNAAVSVVQSLYGESLEALGFETGNANLKRHQDIVDAILIGSLGMSRISSAQIAGVELEEFFAAPRRSRSGRRVAVR